MKCEFHKAGCKGRAASVGVAVDVMCTENNHPQLHNQASNKAKKLLSPMTKGQYSSDYHKISNWILGKYMCFLFFFFFLNLKELRLSWQSDLVRVDLMAS